MKTFEIEELVKKYNPNLFDDFCMEFGGKATNLIDIKYNMESLSLPRTLVVPYYSVDVLEKENVLPFFDDKDMLIMRSSSNIEKGKDNSASGLGTSVKFNLLKDDIKRIASFVLKSFSSRYLDEYLKMRNLNTTVQISILIQQYIQAEYSGVFLTKGRGEFYDNFIISLSDTESNYSITSGSKNAIEFVLSRYSGSILEVLNNDENILNQKLTDLIKTAFNIGMDIEECKKNPVIVEWVYNNSLFYILQVQTY